MFRTGIQVFLILLSQFLWSRGAWIGPIHGNPKYTLPPLQTDKIESQNFGPDFRIVGGQLVQNRSHFAFQVSLRLDNGPSCGAFVLDVQNLLTAAHCVTDRWGRILRLSRFRAFIGGLNTHVVSDTTVSRWIRHIFVHAQYDPNTFANDVAVLRIDPLTFGLNINSVPLATSVPPVNTICTVSGWGVTAFQGRPSTALLYVNVPIVSHAVCAAAYGPDLLPGMVCAGYTGRDACQGDSGGPLVCNGSQVGVVSWGIGCGHAGFPGVYASVPFYHQWILTQQQSASASKIMFSLYALIYLILFLRPYL